jgi:type I restriction enzyme, S subunit
MGEQQKIASILSKVDELIKKTDQVIQQTQRLNEGLTQRLLTKGIGHSKFKDIALGLKFLKLSISEDWSVTYLEDVAQITDTPDYTALYFSKGVPVIRTTDCDVSGKINYTETKFTSEEEYEKRRKIIDPDMRDVLYTREAPPGIAVIVDRKKVSVGQRVILLKPKPDSIMGEFLVSFLNSNLGRIQSDAMILKTTVEHVNIEDIKKFKIPIPTIDEQKQILGIRTTINRNISNLKNSFELLLDFKSKYAKSTNWKNKG